MNTTDVAAVTVTSCDEVSNCPPPEAASSSSSKRTVPSNDNNENTNSMFMPTDVLYMTYDGNFMTDCRSKIVDVVSVVPPSMTPKAIATTIHPIDDRCKEPMSNNNNHHQQQQVCIVLDRTVMHAQGGGQPTDIGHLQVLLSATARATNNDWNEKSSTSNDATTIGNTIIDITKVELDRITGIVKHYGTILPLDSISSENEDDEDENHHVRLRIGDIVQVTVNPQQRQLLSECHTAGHVVDAAMYQCGYHLKPSKGYHFLDSPYVEYYYNQHSISINEKQDLSKLQLVFQQLLQQDIPTEIELLTKEEAHIRCNSNNTEEPFFDMDMYCTTPNDTTVRVVTVAGYACPCGGTHVRSTGNLLQSSTNVTAPSHPPPQHHHTWNITGIKCKPKGYVRIKYGRVILNET